MGDVGVINHTIYVSNLNEKIKKPLLKKSLHRWACLLVIFAIKIASATSGVGMAAFAAQAKGLLRCLPGQPCNNAMAPMVACTLLGRDRGQSLNGTV